MPLPSPRERYYSVYPAGKYIVVGPHVPADGFQLSKTFLCVGYPNALIEYIRNHPEEYPPVFLHMIDTFLSEKEHMANLHFHTAHYQEKRNGPWCAVAIFGPMKDGVPPIRLDDILSVVPFHWRYTCHLFPE